jgi:hypothetical protein
VEGGWGDEECVGGSQTFMTGRLMGTSTRPMIRPMIRPMKGSRGNRGRDSIRGIDAADGRRDEMCYMRALWGPEY